MSATTSRKHSGISPLHLLVGLLAAGVSIPAFAQSDPYPTYVVGANQNGTQGPNYPLTTTYPWVASDGAFITPAGTQVYLGVTTRAKAVALNPNTATHTAAVLQMGAPQAVTIFNTQTGKVLQTYSTLKSTDADGSHNGIVYTPDGLHLLFSQDGSYGPTSYVAVANVNPTTGLLTDGTQVSVPLDVNSLGNLTNVTCFPGNSPPGTSGSFAIPCGYPVSIFSDDTFTSYPLGIAISPDGKTAYAVLDNNDTLTKIDLTAATPKQGAEVRVGNVPHSVVISPDGTDRLRLQRGWPDCHRGRLPGILQRHPGRRRLADWRHGHRHRFRGQPVHVYGHRQHLDRSAPDWHGLLEQLPAGRQYL